VIKGFFKDACGMLRRVKGSGSSKLRAYKKEIDGLVFVTPRQIPLVLPEGAELGLLERPVLGGGIGDDLLREWFNYGALRGLGQWRNASYGRFEWEELG
jgi:hypothetical protein